MNPQISNERITFYPRAQRKKLEDQGGYLVNLPFVPLTFYGNLNEQIKVAEFITPSRSWNVLKLRGMVSDEDDVEMISSIPICGFGSSDRWTLHYNNHGMYTVKSGYKITMREQSFF